MEADEGVMGPDNAISVLIKERAVLLEDLTIVSI
jgi:hypothetical protein